MLLMSESQIRGTKIDRTARSNDKFSIIVGGFSIPVAIIDKTEKSARIYKTLSLLTNVT